MSFAGRLISLTLSSRIIPSLLLALGLSLLTPPLLALAQGEFTEIEYDLARVAGSSVAWGDYDKDGDLDILLTGDNNSEPISRIYRCDCCIYFNDIGAGLTDVALSSAAWGDYDQDGDLDILLTGNSISFEPLSLIYRNDDGLFTDIGAGLTGVGCSSAVWGDYDQDGDLDILLTGFASGDVPTSLIYRNDGGLFTDIGAGLTDVAYSSVAWGDYDNDGDLDILLTGQKSGPDPLSLIYRNDDGLFTDIGAGLTDVAYSSVAWGDYDNDGDLDILLTGQKNGPDPLSLIYRNDGGTFTDIGAGLTDVAYSSVAWGDYDNDGDLDILLTGDDGPNIVSLIYRNDGGIFTDIGAGLTGVFVSSVAWGDYTGDGDLDILLTGQGGDYYPVSKIYRNNTPVANTAPSAPGDLSAVFVDDELQLQWNSASDAQTPTSGLTYNVRIGTTPGASDICPPMARVSGHRLIPAFGNANLNTSWPFDLPLGNYYWSVQTLDTSFEGSPFAVEASFIASASLTSIEDISNDQGRQVRLTWSRSEFDAPNDDVDITGYQIYRRQDGRLAGWDALDWVAAYGDDIYSSVVPTLCDSTAEEGICWSTFMIRATTPDPFTFVDSAPDSGYSVDNLAPSVPDGFKFGTSTLLVWEASGDEDFDYFTVYGSANEVFDESAVLIDYTIGTEMDVAGQDYSYYHLTATDFAGNESGAATVFDATDVPPGLPERFALHAPSPNPFNPRTFLRFDLPEAATVSLRVYDLSGRLLRTLVDEHREAGHYEEIWNGRDDRGRAMATGVYLCRIETDTFTDSKRMTLLK